MPTKPTVGYQKSKQQPQLSEELQIRSKFDNTQMLHDLKDSYDKKDMKTFYATAEHVLRIKHGNPVVKAVIGDNNEVTNDKDEVAKLIAEYFRNVYKKPDVMMIDTTSNTRAEVGDSCLQFTTTEIRDAMKECNFNKGMGPDGFHGSVLKPDTPSDALTNNIIN